MYSAFIVKPRLKTGSRESFVTPGRTSGGLDAGDPGATSSSAATWLATRRARTQRILARNPAPLCTRDALNNAPMMRCSTSQTLARVCDVLQWNGWCQSVQRSADADEQLKHTSGALHHLQ